MQTGVTRTPSGRIIGSAAPCICFENYKPLTVLGPATVNGPRDGDEFVRGVGFSYRALVERVPAVVYVDDTNRDGSAAYVSPRTAGGWWSGPTRPRQGSGPTESPISEAPGVVKPSRGQRLPNARRTRTAPGSRPYVHATVYVEGLPRDVVAVLDEVAGGAGYLFGLAEAAEGDGL